MLRIFNKAFKEILTAYHKPIKLLHLLHTYFERCFIFLTNPKQTSNTSSTFQLCQVICKNKSNMITPKENYFNHAFLTIMGRRTICGTKITDGWTKYFCICREQIPCKETSFQTSMQLALKGEKFAQRTAVKKNNLKGNSFLCHVINVTYLQGLETSIPAYQKLCLS